MRRWLILVWLLALPWCTVVRAADFQSEWALWTAAARVAPHKPRVWVNLGAAAVRAHDASSAEAAYRRARVEAAGQPSVAAWSDVMATFGRATLACQRGADADARRLIDALRQRYPAAKVRGTPPIDVVTSLAQRFPEDYAGFAREHPCARW